MSDKIMFDFKAMMNAFQHPSKHPDIVALKQKLREERGLVAAVVECLEQGDLKELSKRACDKCDAPETTGKLKRA